LRSRYTEGHPDVIALKQKIAQAEQLKKQRDSEMAAIQKDGTKAAGADSAALLDAQGGTSSPMMQVQSQLKANQLEISNIQKHEKELESQISGYQARLNLTPQTEQELTSISRGYEESKTNYNSLLQKQMQSQLATSLEHRQQGEQFRVIDPPSLPTKPWSPNHLRFSLGGLLAGICVGLCLTTALELTNVCVRQEKDLEGVVPVGILVGIPHLSTPSEELGRVREWWTELGTATVLVLMIVLGNLYSLYKG
jgi:uncharacterized protein involved in exopolysaccharide biosynthesis